MYSVNRSQSTNTDSAKNTGPTTGSSSWYASLANAWGSALDRQADKTAALAQQLANGDDEPAAALQVAAAAHQLSFIAQAAATASNSIGQALETLGRKQ